MLAVPDDRGFEQGLRESMSNVRSGTLPWVRDAVRAVENVQDGGEGSSPGDGALEDLQRAVEHLGAWLGLDYVPHEGSGIIEPHLAEVAKLVTTLPAVRWVEGLVLAELALAGDGNVSNEDMMRALSSDEQRQHEAEQDEHRADD